MDEAHLITAFSMGLLGSVHCVGMCGGISAALGQGTGHGSSPLAQRLHFQVLFGIGRIGSYMMAGMLAASLGEGFRAGIGGIAGPVLRSIAALLMLVMGLYVSGWWTGLTHIERLGQPLWRRVAPLGRRLLPVTRASQALPLGLLWGWLPCGLVYSTLALSVTATSPVQGALTMGYFGLGTLPAMTGVGLASHSLQRLVKRSGVRQMAGVLLIGMSLWTAVSAWHHDGHTAGNHDHSLHQERLP